MKSDTNLKEDLKSEAHRLGFQLVGVTTPDPPPHLDVYNGWLAAGHHAGMSWMGTERNRQRRENPRLILPECRSILALGMAYPPSPLDPLQEGKGRIASYAWGDDYHDVLPDRLKAVVTFIEGRLGSQVPNRWYTDTGPILEREIAQRAGLGWIGKNSCLIAPQAGSYFVLAEILLGIKLPPDEPLIHDHCGSCTDCIEACPTSCILSNRTIDANRCISYLTIEEKGNLPMEYRSQIGNWIFGCDVCQQVCPWNQRFALPSKEPRFAARPERVFPTLEEVLMLTPEAFSRGFKGSPIKRTKRRGFLRNVAAAIGNTSHTEGVSALTQALDDNEALVRAHAAWALGEIGGVQADQVLKQALVAETDDMVRGEIMDALARI